MSFLFLLMSFFLSFGSMSDMEKVSYFECGFSSVSEQRFSFSVQFFLFILLFLVFDVEVSLLLPSPLFFSNFYFSLLGVFFFLLVLFLGMCFEVFKGVFDWSW